MEGCKTPLVHLFPVNRIISFLGCCKTQIAHKIYKIHHGLYEGGISKQFVGDWIQEVLMMRSCSTGNLTDAALMSHRS